MPPQKNDYVTLDVVRELLSTQRENMVVFFRESINTINSRIDLIVKDVNDVKQSLNFSGDVTENKLKDADAKIINAMEELKMVKATNMKLSDDCSELKKKNTEMEDRSRRNNLRISGLHEDENESWEETEEKVKSLVNNNLKIKTNIKIERAHRVGMKNRNDPRPRTIVFKLLNYKDKVDILHNANLLKGSNIYINEDYSSETVKIRKELFEQAKQHRASGKFAKVVYNRLVVLSNRNDEAIAADEGEDE